MVAAAFNLFGITVLFFIFGMIKPGWALFFLNKPGRFPIIVITTVMVMISITMYGEGHRREQTEKVGFTKIPESTVPVPVPKAEAPVSAQPQAQP